MRDILSKQFYLKADCTNFIRTLPLTVTYMALATLFSTLLFHFSHNVINVSVIYILAILGWPGLHSVYGWRYGRRCFGQKWPAPLQILYYR